MDKPAPVAAPEAQVWQYSQETQELFASAADLYDWLCRNQFHGISRADLNEAKSDIAALSKRRDSLVPHRQLMLPSFASAYSKLLDGDVYRSGGYSYWRPRRKNSRPKVEPLSYEYLSYHEKAWTLVDQALEVGEEAENLHNIPYLLDMFREPVDLAVEFIDTLKHEAVVALRYSKRLLGNLPSHGDHSATGTAEHDLVSHAYLAVPDLARKYGLRLEATRKRLGRWRSKNDEGWVEIVDRRNNEPKYLYLEDAVRPILESK